MKQNGSYGECTGNNAVELFLFFSVLKEVPKEREEEREKRRKKVRESNENKINKERERNK